MDVCCFIALAWLLNIRWEEEDHGMPDLRSGAGRQSVQCMYICNARLVVFDKKILRPGESRLSKGRQRWGKMDNLTINDPVSVRALPCDNGIFRLRFRRNNEEKFT